jgi:hypothetical protein
VQIGDTGPVESARRSNSRVLGSSFSGLAGQVGLSYKYKGRRELRPIVLTKVYE